MNMTFILNSPPSSPISRARRTTPDVSYAAAVAQPQGPPMRPVQMPQMPPTIAAGPANIRPSQRVPTTTAGPAGMRPSQGPSVVQVPRLKTTVPRPTSAAVPRPMSAAVPRPATVDVPRPATVDIPRPSTAAVPRPTTVAVPRPLTAAIPRPTTAAGPTPVAIQPGQGGSGSVSLLATSKSFRDQVSQVRERHPQEVGPRIRSCADEFMHKIKSFDRSLSSLKWTNVHVRRIGNTGNSGKPWIEIRGPANQKDRFRTIAGSISFQIYLDELQVVLSSTSTIELTHVAIRGTRSMAEVELKTTCDTRFPINLVPINLEEDRRFFDTLASLSVIPLAVRRAQDMWVGEVVPRSDDVIYFVMYAGSEGLWPYLARIFAGRLTQASGLATRPSSNLLNPNDVQETISTDGPRPSASGQGRTVSTMSNIAGRLRDVGRDVVASSERERKRVLSAEGALAVSQPQRQFRPQLAPPAAPRPPASHGPQLATLLAAPRPSASPELAPSPAAPRPPANHPADRLRRINGLRAQISALDQRAAAMIVQRANLVREYEAAIGLDVDADIESIL